MKRFFIILVLLAMIGGGIYGYTLYQRVFKPVVPPELEDYYLYIPTGSSFADLKQNLFDKGFTPKIKDFEWVADKMSFGDAAIKPGRYQISQGASLRGLIQHLRTGNQSPVKMTIRAAKTYRHLAGQAAEKIEADSASILKYIDDTYLPSQDNYSKEDLISLFIPNTYEFYWNTSPENFMRRMEKEHARFWNTERTQKAKALNLSEKEVYTLASIVERETQLNSEKPRIAGVYVNRLRKGIPLQADPTVIFALQDWSIRRVLKKHLEFDSPYNTYKHAGLPPGPIYMPTIRSLDAALDAEDHNYLYFCADPEINGGHAFASSLKGHNRNAQKYHRWANANGIR